MTRNFNESMQGLIECALQKNKERVFEYKQWLKTQKVNIGDVGVWALYGDVNDGELLAALIWRRVIEKRSDDKERMMFEVLFLSTSEVEDDAFV